MARRTSRDTVAAVVSTVTFSLALSLSSLALPLLAVRAGYSLVAIGLLTAMSAVVQLLTRLVVARLMRRFSDWVLVVAAALLMAGSTGVVALSTALIPLVLSQFMQGAARGAFWTGSQTHVVRGNDSASKALARVNVAGSAGQLVGPLLAGLLIEWSLLAALLVSSAIGLVAAAVALLLDRLPPFLKVKDRAPGRLWRRPGVDVGCWSGVSTGAWRGLLGSYIPVVLAANHSATVVGVLMSVANGAVLVGPMVVARKGPAVLQRVFAPATLVCAVATGSIAYVAVDVWLVGLALVVSGAAVGLLQVVGAAIAVMEVQPDERGDVIAATGTFRALALLSSPLLMAGMLTAVALGPAMVGVGVAMALPSVLGRRAGKRDDASASG